MSLCPDKAGHETAGTRQVGAGFDTGAAAASAAVCANLGQPITASQWATLVPRVPYRAPCG